ncbi:MAG: SDR family oxidoreductase, partial [Chloroflexota bacterium]|nr:SDR family oxidoreductase [Chloroflexota bacterium]
HILFSNAGIGDRAPAEEMTPEQWHRVLDINLSGAWYFDQAVGRHMIERGIMGSIINTSSITSIVGITTGNANYAATKGGLNALTRTLAIEWAPHGIRVNAIAPTHVKTALIEQKMRDDPELAAFFLGNIPLGRMGEPEDVAGAAIYLASEAGALVNGHILVVDGGHTIR